VLPAPPRPASREWKSGESERGKPRALRSIGIPLVMSSHRLEFDSKNKGVERKQARKRESFKSRLSKEIQKHRPCEISTPGCKLIRAWRFNTFICKTLLHAKYNQRYALIRHPSARQHQIEPKLAIPTCPGLPITMPTPITRPAIGVPHQRHEPLNHQICASRWILAIEPQTIQFAIMIGGVGRNAVTVRFAADGVFAKCLAGYCIGGVVCVDYIVYDAS
jgi:hypothetical protein